MAASGAGHRRCRAGRVPGALLAAPRLAAPAAPQPRGGGGDAALGCPRRSAQARGSRRRLAAAEPSRAGPPALYGAPPAGRARMAGGPAGRPQAAAPAPERACVRRRLGVRTGPQQRVGGRADGRRSPFSARGWRQLRRSGTGRAVRAGLRAAAPPSSAAGSRASPRGGRASRGTGIGLPAAGGGHRGAAIRPPAPGCGDAGRRSSFPRRVRAWPSRLLLRRAGGHRAGARRAGRCQRAGGGRGGRRRAALALRRGRGLRPAGGVG